MKKNWLDFGDLDPIFKVTAGLRLLENGFSAPYLQNEWMDFNQTCTAILLRQGQELIRFWWPWHHFQDHRGLRLLENACPHPISRMNGRILTKFVHLYSWDIEKNCLDFGDLDPIFNITQGLRLLKNGFSAPYHEGMDGFWPNLHNYIVVTWKRTDQILVTLTPFFKVTGGLRLLENGFSAHYLQNEWMDFDQTCTAILLRQEQELVRFWWPWPHFQGHTRA